MADLRKRGNTAEQRDASFDQVNVSLPIYVDNAREQRREPEPENFGPPMDQESVVTSGYGVRYNSLREAVVNKRGKPVKRSGKQVYRTVQQPENHFAVDVAARGERPEPVSYDPHETGPDNGRPRALAPADMHVLYVGKFDDDSGNAVVARVVGDQSLLSVTHVDAYPDVTVGSYLPRGTPYGETGKSGRMTGEGTTMHIRWRTAPNGATVLENDGDGKPNADLISNYLQRQAQDPYFSLEDELDRQRKDIRNYRDAEPSFNGVSAKKGTRIPAGVPSSRNLSALGVADAQRFPVTEADLSEEVPLVRAPVAVAEPDQALRRVAPSGGRK